MEIVQVGEAVLRQRTGILTAESIRSREIQELIDSMRETMHKAPGVGLAAPQIGLPLSLAVIEDKPEYLKDLPEAAIQARGRKPVPFHVIINPVLTIRDDTNVEFFEGCLSLKGFTAAVPRAQAVRVECLDHQGQAQVIEASGWYARILQHEIDHLRGKLYVDRMYAWSFTTVENYARYWKDKPVTALATELGPRS